MQQHLVVLVVSGHEQHGGPVRELQLLVAEGLVGGLADDGSLFGQLGDERLVLHVVHIGGELLGASLGHCLAHVVLSGVGQAVGFACPLHDYEVLVAVGNHLGQRHVDHLNGNVGGQHLHGLVEVLNRGDGLARQIVVAIFVAKLVVGDFCAVGILLLQRAQVVGLGALILRLGEAELGYAASLTDQGGERLHVAAVLGNTAHLEGVLRRSQQVHVVIATGLQEGTIGVVGQLL